jgi:pyruvate/2-oxoglutarate dehydrogenase complex dihydrolipoamide dehydrogenase (E3) component
VARFDVVVLGSGSGGRAAAGRLADAGLEVAMVESELVGGECPYWACMPSKALLRPTEAVAGARRVPGVEARIGDWDAVVGFRDEVVSGRDDAGKATSYSDRGVTILRGHGMLDGPGAVTVDGRRHEAARVVIATGSQTSWPPVDGLREVDAWTNREAMELREPPASALVLGAGPVGVEIGQMLGRYGCLVTIADGSPRVLGREDPAVGDLLGRLLSAEGIDLALGSEVSAVGRDGPLVRVTLGDGSERRVERVVVATGRRPRVDDIGLDSVGITPGDEGIAVDGRCRAADGVWAVGDVTGVGRFTHVAAYQGRVACADILGSPIEADYTAVPRAVFCDPEVAAVGPTAEEARAAGIDVATASVDMADVERASTYGRDVSGLIGVVADRRAGVLVGAHAVGPLASEWIHLAVLAVRARVPLAVLGDVIAQFPSFADGVVTAVRALDLGSSTRS